MFYLKDTMRHYCGWDTRTSQKHKFSYRCSQGENVHNSDVFIFISHSYILRNSFIQNIKRLCMLKTAKAGK